MTYIEHRTCSIEYPYPAHGLTKFAIGLGVALVTWGRNRSAHGPTVTYRQQTEHFDAARTRALRLGGIR